MLATVEDQEKYGSILLRPQTIIILMMSTSIELINYKDSLVLLTLDLGITKVSYQEIFMVR